jgi:FkbM family methyltransferase
MAAGWQGWKRVVRTPLKLTLFNGTRFKAYPDCSCSSAACYFRLPNFRPIEVLRQEARRGTLVDVGANVGLMTMLLADVFKYGLLFEPNPLAAARARENIQLNNLPFQVHEVALSDRSGTVRFEDRGGVHTCNRTVSDFATDSRTITVPSTTMDEFLAQRPPLEKPITVIKIDVEGHENAVLRGMGGLLRAQRPTVMFEYLQRTNLQETLQILGTVDYRVFSFSEKGRMISATLQTPPLQDLIAVPAERASYFI